MQLPVMPAAEWHRELIAHFETDCPGLGKPQVMWIAGCRPQIRHGCEATNFRCALSRSRLGSAMDELALVDPVWDKPSSAAGASGGAVALISVLILSFGKNSFIELLCRAAVIVRRARDWCRIIRVQSDARLGVQIREHRL